MKRSLSESFECQSIYLAAFCLSADLKLTGIDRTHGSKVTFIFEGEDAKKIALGFYNGEKVVAQEYSDKFRTLKDMIFQR